MTQPAVSLSPTRLLPVRWPLRERPTRHLLAWGAAVALVGSLWILAAAWLAQREAFETSARIAHRVLSQRVVQHDAVLATLSLWPATAPDEPTVERGLPALMPQLLAVQRRSGAAPWPDAATAPGLDAAEQASRRLQRAVLAGVDLAAGRYTLVRAGAAAAHALQIDIAAMLQAEEWPLPPDSPVQVRLLYDGQERVLLPGAAGQVPWHYRFAKTLAADSQPFELRLALQPRWTDLPLLALTAWWALCALGVAGAATVLAQRAQQRRDRELLRLSQVGRLNALGELAAGIAHELNQPLTAVVANTAAAQRLLDDPDDEGNPAAARRAMAQATQQARRAAEVLSRLRRLIERPADAGAAAQTLALAPVLDGVLDLCDAEVRRLGVRTRVICEAGAEAVRAEPVALEQIVHNLVSNALQALAQVPEGARELRLRAHAPAAGRVAVEVIDSGPGVPAGDLPHLFEPFFSTRPGGLGLGLSLCETLATGLGGRLHAAPAVPRGMVFTLELPTAHSATHAADRHA